MADLGKKHICTNPDCGIKFYDFGKPEPICPKCKHRVNESEEKELLEKKRVRPVEEEEEAPEEKPAAAAEEEETEEKVEESLEEEEEFVEDQRGRIEEFDHEFEE
jgi:uncharacterized protein (TIGR02300 family)